MEDLAFSLWVWAVIYAAMLAAGTMQGMFGFGFPILATPVTVLVTDVKTAIVLNMLPTLTLNLVSIVRGGNWSQSLGMYWRVAAFAAIGSFIGAQVVIYAPPEPLRLLLAAIIFAYLGQERLARLDWGWLSHHPRTSTAVFGTTAGFFSGSVNNSLPVLLIYFVLLNVSVTVMTQTMNFCFFFGRSVQALTLGAAGEISMGAALANIPLALVAIGGYVAGARIQRLFSAATFRRLLRYILFVLGLMLTAQGLVWFVR
ncbi:MAG: sulfite exporter TauE/SafE family protein [Betaproteobacteria bacterium]|nr:sulfite exporter TauE/SafE family protein [Betaproteobacteria bacterium]